MTEIANTALDSAELAGQQQELSPQDQLARARQDAESKLASLNNPDFRALAERQIAEIDALANTESTITQETLDAHHELNANMEAMDLLEEDFGGLNDNFDLFTGFLNSSDLSMGEMSEMFAMMQNRRRQRHVARYFSEQGYPTNRAEFALFAEQFGIRTSTEQQESEDETIKNNFLTALDTYRGIEGVPELDALTSMISNLENLEGAEARSQMEQIFEYLVGPDGQSGELDNILTALHRRDRENAAAGQPTQYLQSFVRVTRDFSPEVSRRIDLYLETHDTAIHSDPEIGDILREGIVGGSIPEGSSVQSDGAGEIVATTPEGDTVTIEVDGDSVTRSYSLEGSDFALGTEIQRADFSGPTAEYEAVRQEVAPQLQGVHDALAFLENPMNFRMSLEDAKPTVLQLLGSSLYNDLGIRQMQSKDEIVQAIRTIAIPRLESRLKDAKDAYREAVRAAVEANRRRTEAADEAVKATLRRVQALGFDLWDIDYLMAQMRSGFLVPDLGVPFDLGNVDLRTQDFGEPVSETDSFDRFNEYLTRFVNKGITGNPEGLNAAGELVGFSLHDAIMNPDSQTKTQGEIMHMMKQGGIWSETIGFNKEQAMANLRLPLN